MIKINEANSPKVRVLDILTSGLSDAEKYQSLLSTKGTKNYLINSYAQRVDWGAVSKFEELSGKSLSDISKIISKDRWYRDTLSKIEKYINK